MNLHLFSLKVFLTVVDEGNFSKAAKKLFLTQPAVSLQIKKLENIWGLPLIDRTGSQIKLTQAGLTLYQFAKKINSIYHDLELNMNRHKKIISPLRAGVSSTFGEHIFPKIVKKFCNIHPNLDVTYEIAKSAHLLSKLNSGSLDIAIVGNPILKGLKYEKIFEDKLVFVAPKSFNIKEELSFSDLQSLPLIVREEACGLTEKLKEFLSKHKKTLKNFNVVCRVRSNAAAKAAVTAGLGVTLISKFAICDEIDNFSIIKIKGSESLKRYFYLAYLPEQSSDIRIYLFSDVLKTSLKYIN